MATSRGKDKVRYKSLGRIRYHLRFQILPGKNVAKETQILADFCLMHRIEEVVLFIAAEEWNNGLLSAQEEDIWFDTVKEAKIILDAAGVTVSLNPWMTVLHCSRGRAFPKDRPFDPMVSPSGEKSKACASFADKHWQEYLFNLYGRFAKLGFRVIWVEDDFRYHNHGPLPWGGGFEPAVLKRFSIRLKRRSITRKKLMEKILAPGKPHPWRKLWLETWRDLQIEVAKGLSVSVEENSPCPTKIGLMSSGPWVHSAEGRDWGLLFEALRTNGGVVHRPHYAYYSDEIGRFSTYPMMMLDWQKTFRPSDCEVTPEVENFPFTCWTKSDTQTWVEMSLSTFHGADAMLLDLFPFSGNRADEEPRIGRMLDQSRPALEWIKERFDSGQRTDGVGLPWHQDAQQYVHLNDGAQMGDLNATPLTPGRILLINGVPVTMRSGNTNAIFGKMAWVFDDTEILEMLSSGMILDGLAADILVKRGFGDILGIEVAGTICREEGKYAIEKIVSEESGCRPGFYINCNVMPEMCRIEPISNACEWSEILEPDGKRFGAGIVVFENRLGGRIITFAASDPARLPMSFQRQAIIHSSIKFIAQGKSAFPLVTGGAHLMPMCFEGTKNAGLKVVVLNGSPDPATPILHFTRKMPPLRHATLLKPLEKPLPVRSIKIEKTKGTAVFTIDRAIPHMSFAVLEWDFENNAIF